ncbi:MAG TPA: hypothetical protein VF006_21375, partial [Longimicrobium sp.]
LAPWPLTAEGVVGAFRDALVRGAAGDAPPRPEGWDGRAGERVAAALAAALDGGLNGESRKQG